MKITLTKTEAESYLKSSLNDKFSDVETVTIESPAKTENGLIPTVSDDLLIEAFRNVTLSTKILTIKAVRDYFNKNGLSLSLASAKNIVEAVLNKTIKQ